MQLPVILDCDAVECAYNTERRCHAAAITVGDGMKAACDTYWRANQKGGNPDVQGEVGACRADGCRHNSRLECTAPEGIRVGHRGGEVDCLTFSPR